MADIVSKETRSRMMSGIKSKDTKPEIQVRKYLFAEGYRYRINNRGIPGNPDLSLKKYNAVIFVNGCFWHGHEHCDLFRIPKSRIDFWTKKIGGNIERDTKTVQRLTDSGWRVCIVWECALKGKYKLEPKSLVKAITGWIESGVSLKEFRGNRQY